MVKRKVRYWYKIQLSRITRLLTHLVIFTNLNPKVDYGNHRIQIVLDPVHKDWVIEKLARKLIEFYPNSCAPELTYVPSTKFPITHWMHYQNVSLDYVKKSSGVNTFLVPHVDTQEKEVTLRRLVEAGGIPIFMSKQHALEISKRLDLPELPRSILPGSDVAGLQEKLRIVISSNFYPDGRKNEHYFTLLAKEYSLRNFHFTFIGKSWKQTGKQLEKSGATVEFLDPSDRGYLGYKTQVDLIRGFDLFLYLGFDEGSLGSLDAYLLGVPLLISRQGFHMEFEETKNLRLFANYEEFVAQLMQIEIRGRPSNEVAKKWTWYSYASAHQQLWESLSVNLRDR
jgi:hypothetical protein